MTLAVLLNWEALKLPHAYRTLLFLPYAVPGFISILVFKGLFNQNFGEINAILTRCSASARPGSPTRCWPR
jgi:maltose/maltodextrin transport system permease protein